MYGKHNITCAEPSPLSLFVQLAGVTCLPEMDQSVLYSILCFCVTASIGDDVILKPLKQGQPQVGMVFIQGFEIKPEQYIPLATAIQNASNYSLWVGIPDFTFDIPEPIEISEEVERIIKSLQMAGMNTTSIFFAAHSLGGIILQNYIHDNPSMGFAQVLMGSYILRKYRDDTYPVPTLTIGGELDGLSRVTRIMEAYYHSVLHAQSREEAIKNFPVTLIEGMSHMEFASGDPPSFIKDRDLRPEITYEQAHQAVASLVTAFFEFHLDQTSSLSVISTAVDSTGLFMAPIVTAFELEGYHNFKPPCNDNPPSQACTLGSKWSEYAQVVMGGLKEAVVNDSDAFHPVWDVFSTYHPRIMNSCSSPIKGCILQTTTVTQNVYNELDKMDAAMVPISASEMRVKMSSRQAIMEAAGYPNVNFNTSDGYSICKVINQASYNWALSNASQTTVMRFQKFGEPYIMGEDKGPYSEEVWVWDPLDYHKTQNSSGDDIVEVSSPMMRTSKDYILPDLAGQHYCKALSPARAIEWIYVDGLRDHYNIK